MSVIESSVAFVTDPTKMLVVVVSLLLGISLLLAWKRTSRPWLLYAHLLFVLSPLFYFALSINCSLSLVQGLLSWCTALFAKFTLYILPPLMAASFIGGYLIIPRIYRMLSKPLRLKQFSELCNQMGIAAELFLIDKAKPLAFAAGSKVFISVGMFDLLSRKELEAVLLHELYHVKSHASWNKFSAGFVHTFSPIAWFSASSVEHEECSADAFAVRLQKTHKYLKSAKQKVVW